MKTCCKCRVAQPYSEFNKSKDRKDGHNPQCKTCCKAYRTRNKEYLSAKKKEYFNANRSVIREKKRAFYKKHKQRYIQKQIENMDNPERWARRLLAKSRERAKQDDIEHSITIKDIVIPQHCPYLGVELTFKLGDGQLPTNASIDRVDSTLGYTPGNIQIISRLANTMKSNATLDQLITFAHSILVLHGCKNQA